MARNPIEIGGHTEIIAFGCIRDSYIWSNGKEGIWDGVNGSIMREHIHEDKTFTVYCVMSGCASMPTAPVTIRVVSCEEAVPAPNLVADKNDVLPGTEVVVFANSCDTPEFEWNDGTITHDYEGNNTTFRRIVVQESTEYKVRCKQRANCYSNWSNPYSVGVQKCENVLSVPSIVIEKDGIVAGTEVIIFSSGCSGMKYEWSSGEETVDYPVNGGTFIRASPTSSTGYKVRCKRDEGCKSNWTNEVYINLIPCSESISTPSGIVSDVNNVAANTEVTLFSGGCEHRYEWNDGTMTDNYGGKIETFRKVSPSSTTSYSVRCKKNDECESGSTADFTVRVKESEPCTPAPSAPSISCSDKNIKSGEKTTISSSGCSGSVKWSNGGEGDNIEVSSRGKYTATCTVSGCTSGASNEIEITLEDCTAPSAPSITVSKSSITKGEKVTVSGVCTSGTLDWKSPSNFPGGEVEPNASTTYDAVCTLSTGCSSDKGSATVTVCTIGTPVKYNSPSITVSSTSITKGQTVKVSATCETGSRVSWTAPSGFSGGDHKPDATTVYKAKCVRPYPIPENALEDSDESSKEVKVEKDGCTSAPLTPIIASMTPYICTANQKATIEGVSCNGTLVWSNGERGTSIIVDKIGRYTAICENTCGKSGKSNYVDIVNNLPPPAIVSSSNKLLVDKPVVLSVQIGCITGSSLVWSTGETSQTITISKASSTEYYAICKNEFCESNKSQKFKFPIMYLKE